MEVKIHEKEIQELVFKTLCHVLVKKRLYHKFRCFIGHKNQFTELYLSLQDFFGLFSITSRRDSMNNPFVNTTTRNDIYEVMKNIGKPLKPCNESNTAMIQNRVTILLNALLHSCVECAVNNVMEVEEIGRETFNLICEHIFGKDFVDETEKDVPENVMMMRKLQEQYANENGINDPKLNGFIDWIHKQHKNIFDTNEFTLNARTSNMDDVDWNDGLSWEWEIVRD